MPALVKLSFANDAFKDPRNRTSLHGFGLAATEALGGGESEPVHLCAVARGLKHIICKTKLHRCRRGKAKQGGREREAAGSRQQDTDMDVEEKGDGEGKASKPRCVVVVVVVVAVVAVVAVAVVAVVAVVVKRVGEQAGRQASGL